MPSATGGKAVLYERAKNKTPPPLNQAPCGVRKSLLKKTKQGPWGQGNMDPKKSPCWEKISAEGGTEAMKLGCLNSLI